MTENALAVREDFTITPEDVRKFIAPNATEKEFGLLMGICKAHKLNPFIREVHFVKYGNPPVPLQGFVDTDSDQYRNYGFLGMYGSYKIQILDLTWFTIDEKYYQTRETKDGQVLTFEEPYGFEITDYEYSVEENGNSKKYFRIRNGSRKKEEINKNVYSQGISRQKNGKKREVQKQATKMVYGCKWIVNSDYAYDYGKTTDMPREKSNLRETKLPYNIYRLSNKSYVERMMPFVDLYMRSWMKLQKTVKY